MFSTQALTPMSPLPSGMDPRASALGESHTTLWESSVGSGAAWAGGFPLQCGAAVGVSHLPGAAAVGDHRPPVAGAALGPRRLAEVGALLRGVVDQSLAAQMVGAEAACRWVPAALAAFLWIRLP